MAKGTTTRRRAPARASVAEQRRAGALAGIQAAIGTTFSTAVVIGNEPPDRGVIATGVPSVDVLTGVGGLPRGRLTILHGSEGSGKTTLALEAVAECQRQGGIAVYSDLERKVDWEYARRVGVDLSQLVVDEPDSIQEGYAFLEFVCCTAHTKAPDVPILVVWDSYHAGEAYVDPKKRKGWTDADFPREAKAYSTSTRRLVPVLRRSGAVMLGISQVRKSVGGMGGTRDVVAVGTAPLFYASIILRLKADLRATATGKATGHPVVAFSQKNCVSVPFRRANMMVRYGQGIDRDHSLLEALVMTDLARRGSKFWYVKEVPGYAPFKVDGADQWRLTLAADAALRLALTSAAISSVAALAEAAPVAAPANDADDLETILGGDDDE